MFRDHKDCRVEIIYQHLNRINNKRLKMIIRTGIPIQTIEKHLIQMRTNNKTIKQNKLLDRYIKVK